MSKKIDIKYWREINQNDIWLSKTDKLVWKDRRDKKIKFLKTKTNRGPQMLSKVG